MHVFFYVSVCSVEATLVTNEINRPFPSSWLPPLQSESKCEVFVMVIGATLHMNEN